MPEFPEEHMPAFSMDDENQLIWDSSSKTYKSVPKDRPMPNHPFGTDPVRDRMTPKNPLGEGLTAEANLYQNGAFPERTEKPNFEAYDNSFPSEINPIGQEPEQDMNTCPDCQGQMVPDGDNMKCARCPYRQPIMVVEGGVKTALLPLAGVAARLLLPLAGRGAVAGAAGEAAGTGALAASAAQGSTAGGLMSSAMNLGKAFGPNVATHAVMNQGGPSQSEPAAVAPGAFDPGTYASNNFGPGEGLSGTEIRGEDAGRYLTDGFMQDRGGNEFNKDVNDIGGSSTGLEDDDEMEQLVAALEEDMTDEQRSALEKLHMNLPLVLHYAVDPDREGSADPLLIEIDEAMEQAFPGYKDLKEELEDMEDQPQKSDPLADREARVASHFLGYLDADPDPVIHTARRMPKMCPYHKNLVDFSLTLKDPGVAHNMSTGKTECGSEGYDDKCNFKPAMVTESYWEQRDQQLQEKREQREQQALEQQELTQEYVDQSSTVPQSEMPEPMEITVDLSDAGTEAPVDTAPTGEPVLANYDPTCEVGERINHGGRTGTVTKVWTDPMGRPIARVQFDDGTDSAIAVDSLDSGETPFSPQPSGLRDRMASDEEECSACKGKGEVMDAGPYDYATYCKACDGTGKKTQKTADVNYWELVDTTDNDQHDTGSKEEMEAMAAERNRTEGVTHWKAKPEGWSSRNFKGSSTKESWNFDKKDDKSDDSDDGDDDKKSENPFAKKDDDSEKPDKDSDDKPKKSENPFAKKDDEDDSKKEASDHDHSTDEDGPAVIVDTDTDEVTTSWTDVTGEPLREGQQYEMKNPEYTVPDKITVEGVGSDTLTYVIENAEMRYRDQMSLDDLATSGYEFTAIGGPEEAAEEHRHEHGEPAEAQQSVHEELKEATRHARVARSTTPPDAHLDMARTAGRNYGPMEQREFVDEGSHTHARNIGKLRTDSSHYPSMDQIMSEIDKGSGTDAHFLWGN